MRDGQLIRLSGPLMFRGNSVRRVCGLAMMIKSILFTETYDNFFVEEKIKSRHNKRV